MRIRLCALGFLLALTACSDSTNLGGEATEEESQHQTSGEDSTDREPDVTGGADESDGSGTGADSGQGSPATDPEVACGDMTAQAALEDVTFEEPDDAVYHSTWTQLDGSGFDGCAELSWAILSTDEGHMGPHHILFFTGGEFVSTATDDPYYREPTLERISDTEVEATYPWSQSGPFLESQDRTAIVTYSLVNGDVEASGDEIPEYYVVSPENAPPTP